MVGFCLRKLYTKASCRVNIFFMYPSYAGCRAVRISLLCRTVAKEACISLALVVKMITCLKE